MKNFSWTNYGLLLTCLAGCLEPLDPTVNFCEESNLYISVLSATTAECGLPTGKIEVQAYGGRGQKEYLLNEGLPQTSGSFNSLRPGFYNITVRDSLYCTKTVQVHLNSGVSYSQVIFPILKANCNIPTCHDGSGSISFNVFDNVKRAAIDIKGLTRAKIMPKRGTISAEEIEMISCWVDDGALFN